MSAIGMPPHLLALFQPRRPLEFVRCPKKRKMPSLKGMADCTNLFETETPERLELFETPLLKKAQKKVQAIEDNFPKLLEAVKKYNPHQVTVRDSLESDEEEDEKEKRKKRKHAHTTDPFRTLFVGKIHYDCTERKLRKEFEQYGTIKHVRIPKDHEGKPRGYGFIEYTSDRDMKEAYKQADGRKIDGRRVLVDVERARTVAGWLPRRLSGGRGPPRGGNTSTKKRHYVAPMQKANTKFSVLGIDPKSKEGKELARAGKVSEDKKRERSRSKEGHSSKKSRR